MDIKIGLISVILVGLFGLTAIQAQQTIPATGGEANGNGGSSSYTVGQLRSSIISGTNGNYVVEGVQQPYEISIVTGIVEAEEISLNIIVYPNPANSYLMVNAGTYKTANLNYVLCDINGKLMQNVNAEGQLTKIEIDNLAAANYFVKVFDNNEVIKVFKVIKK